MSLEVKVPSVGESISEVTIASWLKKDGSLVKLDEPICSIESDKATLEIAAPAAGQLKITVPEGQTVKIGTVIARVEPASASAGMPVEEKKESTGTSLASSMPASAPVSSPSETKMASPAAQKILAEKGVPLESVQGSGPGGRILKQDAMSAPAKSEVKMSTQEMVRETFQQSFGREIKKDKMTSLRRTIAKRLVEAKNTTAMLTTFNEVDMSVVMELRKKYKDSFKEKHGVNLGFMSFFTKAVCHALKKFPAVNAQIVGEEIQYHHYADIGVAVSTPKGLVVPVLRNAESMNLAQIELKILELANRARDGKLGIDEMQGGTFTITNGGVFGSMLSTPIINIPQSAILGMHNIVDRPVALNGQVVIRPIMYLALSYDHRIIDGRESVSFLKTVKEIIEEPSRLLLDV